MCACKKMTNIRYVSRPPCQPPRTVHQPTMLTTVSTMSNCPCRPCHFSYRDNLSFRPGPMAGLWHSFTSGGDKYELSVQEGEETHVERDGVDPIGQLLLGVAGVVHVQRHGKDEKPKEHLWHFHCVFCVFVHIARALFPIRGTQLRRTPYQQQTPAVLKFDDSGIFSLWQSRCS